MKAKITKNIRTFNKFELCEYYLKKTGEISKNYNIYLFDEQSMNDVKKISNMEKSYNKKQLFDMVKNLTK